MSKLLPACSREPGILLMSDTELAVRLMALKAAAPRLNIQELVRRRPQILRNKVGTTVLMVTSSSQRLLEHTAVC